MNMLRIWGGGQYEYDYFYDICDELGILVWHDFMFACALYPADKDFLESVGKEAAHQVKRLRGRTCMALWCGDNEVRNGSLLWTKRKQNDPETAKREYFKLNGVLEKAVKDNDPKMLFWPSSPCAGPGDLQDTFHKDGYGDMHYWDVWHSGKPFEDYYNQKPRFCSEFGYQSFPSMETIKEFCPPEGRNVFSPTMEQHQKCYKGNGSIIAMFSQYFRMPQGFDNFLYLSQVQQALAMKMGVEYWRSLMPYCMGTGILAA